MQSKIGKVIFGRILPVIIFIVIGLGLVIFYTLNNINFKDESLKQAFTKECFGNGKGLTSTEYCDCTYNYLINNYGNRQLMLTIIGATANTNTAYKAAAEACKDKIYNPSISTKDWTEQAIQAAKNDMKLPYVIDKYTTLVDITAEPTAVLYHATLSGWNSNNLTNASLKSSLLAGVCANNGLKRFFDKGIDVEYSYVDLDTNKTFFISITKNDCLTK